MTVRQTMRLIGSDFQRMSQLMGIRLFPAGWLFLAITPSIMALMLYRWSHWLHGKRRLRVFAWLLWIGNTYLTGVDILPSARIGRGCYIGHPVGMVIAGRVGEEVSFFGSTVLGGGRGRGDVGGGEGLPVIGDHVFVGVGARILGPVTVGDGAIIGAAALVLADVPAGMVAAGVPARVIKAAADSVDFEARAAEGANG